VGFDKSLNSLSYLRVKEVPNQEALGQAIALYQQGEISLGRAAETAGITRWELMGFLQARGTPVTVQVPSVEEMDERIAAFRARSR